MKTPAKKYVIRYAAGYVHGFSVRTGYVQSTPSINNAMKFTATEAENFIDEYSDSECGLARESADVVPVITRDNHWVENSCKAPCVNIHIVK